MILPRIFLTVISYLKTFKIFMICSVSYWVHCRIFSIYLFYYFFIFWLFLCFLFFVFFCVSFFQIDNFCVSFFKTLVMVVNEQLSVLRTQNEVKSQSWNLEKMAIYPLNRIVRKSRSSGILGKISARILREPFVQVAYYRPLELFMCMIEAVFAMLSVSSCSVLFCFLFSIFSGDLPL